MKDILIVFIGIIGVASLICVLFYPQETDRQKAVKLGCFMGDLAGIFTIVEIIQKFFS